MPGTSGARRRSRDLRRDTTSDIASIDDRVTRLTDALGRDGIDIPADADLQPNSADH
jgi:hypothetical protein